MMFQNNIIQIQKSNKWFFKVFINLIKQIE